MDVRRLRIGEWAMAVSGLALVVSLFLTWYHVGVAGASPDSLSGWSAFSVTDVLLALVGLTALGTVVVVARSPTAAPGIAYEALVLLVSLVALVLGVVRLLDPPGAYLDARGGAWLGVVALLALVASCLVAMRDERLSPDERPTDTTGVPIPARVEVETLPAPRP
jgi:hypothetical protein